MRSASNPLWQSVQQYSEFGWHHTGSPVDDVTRSWFGAQLLSYGAEVREIDYEFDQYEVERCEVRIDGKQVESLPLFYEGVASFTGLSSDSGNTLYLDSAEIVGGGVDGDEPFEDAIDQALAANADLAIVATNGANGRLVVPNRSPRLGSGLPVVLVAGSHSEAMKIGTVEVDLETHRGLGNSASVIGTFNADAGTPILITTPLSGWFECAGERGTGIAIALELAKRLSQLGAVTVIATTGHELGHLGAESAIATLTNTPKAIVHLGASVAAGIAKEDRLELARSRYLLTNLPEDYLGRMHLDAANMGMTLVADPPNWIGEGKNWRELGRPLLSFLGDFPLFHTPQDLPENSTTPDLLDQAMDGVWAVIGRMLSFSA